MQSTPYSRQILMKLALSGQIFEKYSNIKFHENPSNGAELFHADGQTDKTKLIVAFHNTTNELKNAGTFKTIIDSTHLDLPS
jgi:hypothetical protein